jgi:uncharacterized RDD family membrane protein YckC
MGVGMGVGGMGMGAPGAAPYWDQTIQKKMSEFSDIPKKSERIIISPEGLPLKLMLAPRGERIAALVMDFLAIIGINLILTLIPYYFIDSFSDIIYELIVFVSFIVNNVYFLFFEFAWMGRTPGKKMGQLRVINRKGGELTPYAIVARNIVRQVELFFPLALLVGDFEISIVWSVLFPVFWLFAITMMPFWNKDRLRMGDILAGTMVVCEPPHKALPPELATRAKYQTPSYSFNKAQLSIYGDYELQILEEILRKSSVGKRIKALKNVAMKISVKIGYNLPQDLVPTEYLKFLGDFYAAERRELEEGRLYGRVKINKFTPVTQSGEAMKPTQRG